MSEYDWNEIVTIVAAGKPTEQMSLAAAVRTIAQIGDVRAQSSCVILRTGRPIVLLAEILSIYNRDDFPR